MFSFVVVMVLVTLVDRSGSGPLSLAPQIVNDRPFNVECLQVIKIPDFIIDTNHH